MKLKIILIMMMVGIDITVQGQEQALSVGDAVPPIIIKNVLNHTGGQFDLRDYQNELFILDLMSIHCGSCIKKLPLFDSLQQKIEGLHILPIVPEDKEKVERLLQRKQYSMPFAVEREDYLAELFPYKIISHLVWIKNGRVKAITEAKEVTEENVTAMIAGDISLPLKNDLLDYDAAKPLLIAGNGGDAKDLLFQSVITKYLPGVPGGYSKQKNGLKTINGSILAHYRLILNDVSKHNLQWDNRIIIELNDSIANIVNSRNKEAHYFCYSLSVPQGTSQEMMYDKAKDDLNLYFGTYLGIEGRIEKRRVNCLVLKSNDHYKSLKSAGGKVVRKRDSNGVFMLRNVPFNALPDILSFTLRKLPTPVVDITKFSGNIDMDLKGDLSDLNNVVNQLGKYQIILEKEYCEVEMLVISEIENVEEKQ